MKITNLSIHRILFAFKNEKMAIFRKIKAEKWPFATAYLCDSKFTGLRGIQLLTPRINNSNCNFLFIFVFFIAEFYSNTSKFSRGACFKKVGLSNFRSQIISDFILFLTEG